MTVGDISRQLATLAADWVPSLPPADGTAFIGWPPFLIEDLPSYSLLQQHHVPCPAR